MNGWMTAMWIPVGFIVAVLVAWWCLEVRRRRRKARNRAARLRRAQEESAKQEERRVREAEQKAEETQLAIEDLEVIKDISDEFAQLEAINRTRYKYRLPEEDREWIRRRMCELYEFLGQSLLEAARTGDARSFDRLLDMVSSRPYGRSNYRRALDREYGFPPDWHDLVARFIESPDVECIATPADNRRRPEEIRLLAARALKVRQLGTAKLVLAQCDDSVDVRAAVGEVLYSELVKLVYDLHVELGYTFEDDIDEEEPDSIVEDQ